jgi:hypothetical protein
MLRGTSPPGIEDHAGRHCAELGRRGRRLADDDLVPGDHLPVLDQRHGEGRNVDDHIALAEFTRQPAPAIEIGADLVACRLIWRCGEQGFQLGILGVDRQQRTHNIRHILAGNCPLHQRILLMAVDVIVDMMPFRAAVAANMAKRQIRGDAKEGIAGRRGENEIVIGRQCVAKPLGCIIGRVEALLADPLHIGEHLLRGGPRPADRRHLRLQRAQRQLFLLDRRGGSLARRDLLRCGGLPCGNLGQARARLAGEKRGDDKISYAFHAAPLTQSS